MGRPAGRRKIKKRRAQSENSRMKLTVITGIMFLAVLLGFLTARFVENTFTLSEYDKQDLNEYELNIINNILKDRRENKEKEYLITEQ